ncbi:MAG: hypothetical protein ACI8QS_002514 [Planctomycetota bacterium]|jgi:hypothetical protein
MTSLDDEQPDPGEQKHTGFRPVAGRDEGDRGAPQRELDSPEILGSLPAVEVRTFDSRKPAPALQHSFSGPAKPRQASLELGWFLALIAGFGGTMVGALTGLPGAPVITSALALAPLWVRVVSSGRQTASALAAQAWVIGCIAAGAGMGAEGAAGRFSGSVPFISSYQSLVPLVGPPLEQGSGHWPSILPALTILCLVAAFGRFAQALGSILLAAIPVAWMAARAANFTEAATAKGWDPATAFLNGVAPQHFLVVGGALAVAAALADPRPGSKPWGRGHPGRGVFLCGLGAAALGILGEPLILALWRSQTTL